MSGRRMTTKDAIMLSGVLGLAVLGLLLLVLKPFSGFERELPENVGKTASMPAVNATEKRWKRESIRRLVIRGKKQIPKA